MMLVAYNLMRGKGEDNYTKYRMKLLASPDT